MTPVIGQCEAISIDKSSSWNLSAEMYRRQEMPGNSLWCSEQKMFPEAMCESSSLHRVEWERWRLLHLYFTES